MKIKRVKVREREQREREREVMNTRIWRAEKQRGRDKMETGNMHDFAGELPTKQFISLLM